MAHTTTSSTKRTLYSSDSRANTQKPTHSQAQEHHLYEEQPYYSNEQITTRQAVTGDNRRTGGVCYVLIFNKNSRFF